MEIEITYCGVKLRIVGDYHPAERRTFTYPGCAEDFDITAIYAADSKIDLSDFIGMEAVEIMEDIVLKEIKERRHAN